MSGPLFRIPGGRLDRTKPLRFSFDGRSFDAYQGDTIASALLAHGVHLMGRSFKYHRPRGLLGAGVEEPNALVEVTRGPGRFEPNQRATTLPASEGLVVESQNAWPSLSHDLSALNGALSRFIPAGFYYKTFMWPRAFWRNVYEPWIRRMAGLGRAPMEADPDHYAHRWAHCELLIVGSGPAGLAAALAAAPSGKRIILCDQDEELGGSLLSDPKTIIDGMGAWEWLERTIDTLAAYPNVRLLSRTTAFAYTANNMIALAERLTDHRPVGEAAGPRERQWLVRAARVAIAAGAVERPLTFANNDRPGIMLASAARIFVNRYGVLPGSRAALCVNHDSGYRAAFDLADAGGKVAAIIDTRDEVPSDLSSEAAGRNIELLTGHIPVNTRGRLRVTAVGLAARVRPNRPLRWISCDLLMMAGGWTPSVHLFSQSRGAVGWEDEIQAFVPRRSVQAEYSVGACRGSLSLSACLAEGWQAGREAVGREVGPAPRGAAEREDCGGPLEAPSAARDKPNAKAFVDFQNDVTSADIRLAVQEGFRSVEHIKRYTTTGMGTDQGRTSNLNALAVAAQALGENISDVGLTTFRAPFTPTTFGTLAGYGRKELFDPERRTPTHDWASAAGAVFEDVGQWKRARYFPRSTEDMHQAVSRECLAVRRAAGIFDASTLGKIEVSGPDAGVFLDFLYINNLSGLAVGRCRYAIMLREDGFIFDDGVIARLAEDRYHVTTTTGGAFNVLHMMESFRQTELPHMKVWLTSTTEQWAVIAVNGPASREIVASLVDDIDFSPGAFPHMAVREGRICGIPTRLFRVSFTGEVGFEINIPSSQAMMVWEDLHTAGAPLGMVTYGTEAMHVLRAEKGYIIIGQDTDGTVTPEDVGLGGMVSKKKIDFVGKRSLQRAAMSEPDRKQLVGLLSRDGRTLLEEGAQIIDPAGNPGKSIGYVTSANPSATLERPIALSLIKGGRARIGTPLLIPMPDGPIAVDVVEPVFVDREGARLSA